MEEERLPQACLLQTYYPSMIHRAGGKLLFLPNPELPRTHLSWWCLLLPGWLGWAELFCPHDLVIESLFEV